MENQRKCIVIGGGFGGIAAALRARKKATPFISLIVLRAFGWSGPSIYKNGYRHDAGLTTITAPNLFDELFALFGRERKNEIEFIPLKLWYRFRYKWRNL